MTRGVRYGDKDMSLAQMTPELKLFAGEKGMMGLTAPTLQRLKKKEKGYTEEKAKTCLTFEERIQNELLTHRVITHNEYTAWFSRGEMNEAQLKAFVVQFSVFSNLFLIAQLKKMLNADSLEAMRASKEILANEIGVIFNNGKKTEETSPDLVSETGSVDGGVFRFKAGHFEWLLRVGEALGLQFNDMGKRNHGTPSTLFFCDELARLYGNDRYAISQAASFAVENWAAAGFWEELIQGFEKYNQKHNVKIPIGFFTFHSRIEGQHAEHTQEELEEYYFEHEVAEENFIQYGNEMLDGVKRFWDGLNQERLKLA